jgi:hypothetical protein
MRTFAILFSVGLFVTPWMQAKPDVPAQKVAPTPTPTPVSEPLPELLATKITLIQTQYEKAQLVLQASPAYKEFQAASDTLGKQMADLLTPYQTANHCTIDQIAKVCVKPAKAEK